MRVCLKFGIAGFPASWFRVVRFGAVGLRDVGALRFGQWLVGCGSSRVLGLQRFTFRV